MLNKTDKSIVSLFILTAIVALVLAFVTVAQAQVATIDRKPFQHCLEIQNHDAKPVNAIWRGNISWLESTVSSDMITSILELSGEVVEWDSENGAEYPDVSRIKNGTETLGITLEDGTIIRYIFNGWHGGRYYGWLTNSTQRYSATYNAEKHPHARCGFWSVSDDDINSLRALFYQITIREIFDASVR